jgi:hypothetical protein
MNSSTDLRKAFATADEKELVKIADTMCPPEVYCRGVNCKACWTKYLIDNEVK